MMSNREKLIAAARTLLWERGYEAMSPKTIQQHSGAGQGSFYHHFAGKADLAATALEEAAGEKQAEVRALLGADKEPLARIIDYLSAPRDALRGCPMGRMVYEPALAQDMLRQPVATYFAYTQQELIAAIKAAQQCGTLSSDLVAEELAATLVAVVQGGYLIARVSQNPEHMEQATRGVVSLLLALAKSTTR